MKCFTLKSEYRLVMGGDGLTYRAHGYEERHPKPTPGIELSPERDVKVFWDARVPVSDELLAPRPDGGAITRHGTQVTVHRASIGERDGKPVFTPERTDDTDGAIVLLSLGRYGSAYLEYRGDDDTVFVKKHREVETGWFTGYHEYALVRLKPFQKVVAVRTEKKYVLWGKPCVAEELHISFDGQQVFYDVVRPGADR